MVDDTAFFKVNKSTHQRCIAAIIHHCETKGDFLRRFA